MPSLIAPRQYRECLLDADGYIDENSCYVPFWYTRVRPPPFFPPPPPPPLTPTQTGQIVKWSLFLALVLFICLYLTIGFFHAKKRIRENRPPLAYHRVRPPPPSPDPKQPP